MSKFAENAPPVVEHTPNMVDTALILSEMAQMWSKPRSSVEHAPDLADATLSCAEMTKSWVQPLPNFLERAPDLVDTALFSVDLAQIRPNPPQLWLTRIKISSDPHRSGRPRRNSLETTPHIRLGRIWLTLRGTGRSDPDRNIVGTITKIRRVLSLFVEHVALEKRKSAS